MGLEKSERHGLIIHANGMIDTLDALAASRRLLLSFSSRYISASTYTCLTLMPRQHFTRLLIRNSASSANLNVTSLPSITNPDSFFISMNSVYFSSRHVTLLITLITFYFFYSFFTYIKSLEMFFIKINHFNYSFSFFFCYFKSQTN